MQHAGRREPHPTLTDAANVGRSTPPFLSSDFIARDKAPTNLARRRGRKQ
jgi:hypothetical protein